MDSLITPSKEHHINPESAKLMKLATYASVAVAIILIIIKFYAWLVTDSVSMLSSLVDSMLDAVVSIINLLAVRYALTPPDDEHRFGHTGAEDIAALSQAAFIAGSALFIIFNAVHRFVHPEPLHQTILGIWVMVFSLAATFALVTFQRYVVKKTGSTAISADQLHYLGDLLMNGTVIAALLLTSNLGWNMADPFFAILISLYIIYGARKIGRLAFDKLMDREFPEEEKKKITDLVLSYPGVLGMHDLKTRYSGIKPFIQFDLEMDGNKSLTDAHEIAETIMKKLEQMFPGGEVFIHEDPV